MSVGGRSWTPKGRELHLESDLGLVFSSANVSHGTLQGSFSASSSDYKMGEIISTLTTYSHEKHGGMPKKSRRTNGNMGIIKITHRSCEGDKGKGPSMSLRVIQSNILKVREWV